MLPRVLCLIFYLPCFASVDSFCLSSSQASRPQCLCLNEGADWGPAVSPTRGSRPCGLNPAASHPWLAYVHEALPGVLSRTADLLQVTPSLSCLTAFSKMVTWDENPRCVQCSEVTRFHCSHFFLRLEVTEHDESKAWWLQAWFSRCLILFKLPRIAGASHAT